ncbi:MAG: diguanylate cyclase (GGDEF)-like protein [Phycisphaerales bacterium]
MSLPTRIPLLPDVIRRVILVGRTGLDQSLRKAAGTEIVRATDSLSAIGELGDTPEGLEGAQPIVIVGPLPVSPDPAGTAAQLVAALRRVDPRVRVLGTPTAADAEAYDGLVFPDATTERIMDLIDQVRPSVAIAEPEVSSQPEPETEPETEHETGVEAEADHAEPAEQTESAELAELDDPGEGPVIRVTSATSSFGPGTLHGSGSSKPGGDRLGGQLGGQLGGWGEPGDAADDALMIAELLRGHEIRETALRVISRRLGVRVEWAQAEPKAGPGIWVPVALGAHPVGWIGSLAGGVARSRLMLQGEWLASWLRLERQQAELRHAAFTDHLTGAWNRRYFDRYLSATFERARQSRLPVTVMVFDIDYFKTYNDRFGHAAGDDILREVVALLRSCIRPTDRVCRIGGDEFAVIFYEPDGPRTPGGARPMSVYTIARRFQKQICAARFPKLGGELEGTLTVSGGLATFPWDGTTPESLLVRADELALESKRAGKNAITLGEGAERVCHVEFPSEGDPNAASDAERGADPTLEND